MEKKELFLIVGTILTVILSVTLFFFDFYNYSFELKKDSRNNTYISLKNGRYFEIFCGNDVIDNGIDFTLKPFSNFEITGTGNMFKQKVLCFDKDNGIQKETIFERKAANSIKVKQSFEGELNVPDNSFYYTHVEYPLVPEFRESDNYIELYDLNCTTRILKNDDYQYRVIDNFVRIGKEYEKDFNIILEMKIECL